MRPSTLTPRTQLRAQPSQARALQRSGRSTVQARRLAVAPRADNYEAMDNEDGVSGSSSGGSSLVARRSGGDKFLMDTGVRSSRAVDSATGAVSVTIKARSGPGCRRPRDAEQHSKYFVKTKVRRDGPARAA